MSSNKKRNTVVFVIVATLVNVAVMVVLFLAGIIGLSFVLSKVSNPDAVSMYGTLVVIIASLVISWVLYSWFIKKYTKTHNIESSFAPLTRVRKNGDKNAKQ